MNNHTITALIVLAIIGLALKWIDKNNKARYPRKYRRQYRTEKTTKEDDQNIGYKKKPQILSDNEQVLFYRLQAALPEYVILAQVDLKQLINSDNWDSFNLISKRSIDFVIAQQDFTKIIAIELDDSTHDQPDRIKADQEKTFALNNAGIPIKRWRYKNLPTSDEIRQLVRLIFKAMN